jgi:hypothetical protein
MRNTTSEETATREGVLIAQELAAAFRPLVQGLHLSAPAGRLDLALQTLEALST